ncbi:hypothetical protein [Haloarchaeobius sp. HRN-SO-5]|uniref:hypothetical protein n=1 Tax=Haloarchaeobius sp. HRN-SO-5 TaxID=3446118 RepID=UPI003EBD148B
MNGRTDGTTGANGRTPTTTRRRLLAASSGLAVGGLSGCLGRAARSTTNTGAAPAAYYAGDATLAATADGDDETVRVYRAGQTDVRHVPSTFGGGSWLLSADVELDGWSTSAPTKAQDYNSSRSNRPRTSRWDGAPDDDDSDADGIQDAEEALYGYLDGEPTIGERFIVSLPDARLPDDRGTVADELTPRRVLEYFVGDPDGERCAADDGAVSVHRDLACRTLLSATLEEDPSNARAVAVFPTSGGVVVTGASPEAEESARLVLVSEDGTTNTPRTLDAWGDERVVGAAGVTPTLVYPLAVTPADCPCRMPALFYVRRIRHDDQYLYAGGWLVDDGALYENAATLLVGAAPSDVVGLTLSDVERSATDLQSLIRRRRRPGRTTYANVTVGEYDPDAPTLPDGAQPVCGTDGGDYWRVQSRDALAPGTGDCDDTDRNRPPTCVVTALDAPVLHLVDAAELSTEVKFKAGAELSKSVN